MRPLNHHDPTLRPLRLERTLERMATNGTEAEKRMVEALLRRRALRHAQLKFCIDRQPPRSQRS